MKLEEYLIDPRPEHANDTIRWQRLFRLTVLMIDDLDRAMRLLSTLWTFRAFGMIMHRDFSGIKFLPVISPGAAFESEEDYQYFKRKYLGPFTDDILRIIERLQLEID